ncbi:hypothetical protein [Peptostreptococcus stomatis]|uniref:hypothetical protein n=1 Tax=Peptostreptococcus stomatis TaxID=341694 RepID=UPI0028D6E6D3|nr:hypothetical protein [Peptostreptococcus stomatis]
MDLEREYRNNIEYMSYNQKIEVTSIKEKSQYLLFMGGVIISVICAVNTIFSGDLSSLFICLICVALFAVGKTRGKKKYFVVGGIFLTVMIIGVFRGIITVIVNSYSLENYFEMAFWIISNALMIIIGIFISRKLLKKYNSNIDSINRDIDLRNMSISEKNRSIDEYNNKVSIRRQELSEEINEIKNEVWRETSDWFPEDYYALEPVDHFISIVKNHKADTVKEMMAVYDTMKHRYREYQTQEETRKMIEESLYNQQELARLQRVSNILQIGNLIANATTASNTANIARSSREVARNSAKYVDSARMVVDNTASIAGDVKRLSKKLGR